MLEKIKRIIVNFYMLIFYGKDFVGLRLQNSGEFLEIPAELEALFEFSDDFDDEILI